jgi:two-component system, response regulator, stage 0 sporulation protein F
MLQRSGGVGGARCVLLQNATANRAELTGRFRSALAGRSRFDGTPGAVDVGIMANTPGGPPDSHAIQPGEDKAATPPSESAVPAVAEARAADPADAARTSNAGSPAELRTGPFRILVAEDDVEMRRVVADALRDDGYEVVEVADGGRLLVDIAARIKAGADVDSIDLIVSDIRMPICTGLQILEVLRQAHRHTPVILMTAFGDKATRKRAEDLLAVFFDKPFDIDDLRAAITNLLPPDRSG